MASSSSFLSDGSEGLEELKDHFLYSYGEDSEASQSYERDDIIKDHHNLVSEDKDFDFSKDLELLEEANQALELNFKNFHPLSNICPQNEKKVEVTPSKNS